MVRSEPRVPLSTRAPRDGQGGRHEPGSGFRSWSRPISTARWCAATRPSPTTPIAVLRKVREAGITVVGVTGRGARLIELCQRDLPEADFFVLAQGAYVVDQRDPTQPRVLRRDRIPAPTWPRRCAGSRRRSVR